MKREACDVLLEALVAGEALSSEQRSHLEACATCRALARAHGALEGLGQELRRVEDADERVGARLLSGLEDRKRVGPPLLGPLAWGGLAARLLLLMLLGAWLVPSSVDETAPCAERLLSLMDDVDGIAVGEQTDQGVDGWGQMFAAQEEKGQAANPLRRALQAEELDLEETLPTGYQALNDVLEERWL